MIGFHDIGGVLHNQNLPCAFAFKAKSSYVQGEFSRYHEIIISMSLLLTFAFLYLC